MPLSEYRPVWDFKRNRYARWLERLADAHGVYVIREPALEGDPLTLYVGESHTGRLRDTLQRHFQLWRGRTAGATFERYGVEVAVEVFIDPEEAVKRQNALIRSLRPLHNRQIPAPEPGPERDYSEDVDPGVFEDVAAFFDEIAAAR